MTSLPHKYEYRVDLDGDAGPARIVRMVGEKRRVLEVGAGPGSITRLLQNVSGCRVTAMEIDDASIAMLAPFCERAIKADLNDPDWPRLLDGADPFEVLVAADVLEHVRDPLAVLRAMKPLLADGGRVVLSLPHAGHSVVLTALFESDFRYGDNGLLDRTHIRFFGLRNMEELARDAGMKIVRAEFVVRSPEHTELARSWARAPADLQRVLAANPFGQVYQVIMELVPQEREGEAISLMEMGVQPHRPSTKESVKAFMRNRLSPQTYAGMQRVVARIRAVFGA